MKIYNMFCGLLIIALCIGIGYANDGVTASQTIGQVAYGTDGVSQTAYNAGPNDADTYSGDIMQVGASVDGDVAQAAVNQVTTSQDDATVSTVISQGAQGDNTVQTVLNDVVSSGDDSIIYEGIAQTAIANRDSTKTAVNNADIGSDTVLIQDIKTAAQVAGDVSSSTLNYVDLIGSSGYDITQKTYIVDIGKNVKQISDNLINGSPTIT